MLNNQVDDLKLQDKPVKQNFHENKKNCMNHLMIQLKKTSQDITKTLTGTSN